MIEKIKVFLEYNTFPVWLYNEKEEIVDNDLPQEWESDKALEDAFMELSDFYDTFFVDTPNEFRYEGCKNEKERKKLKALADFAIKLLVERNQGKYTIIDNISNDKLLSTD